MKNRYMIRFTAIVLAAAMLAACGSDPSVDVSSETPQNVLTYREKAELLKAPMLDDLIAWEIGDAPAGTVGHAVFISVCDTQSRASVFSGTGESIEAAWADANDAAEDHLTKTGLEPIWVKADLAYTSENVSMSDLKKAVYASRHEFFRYGAAFDENFETALIEAELNGAKIYDYENGGIDLTYLNNYLKKAGRSELNDLPDEITLFRCFGWFCDEKNNILILNSNDLDYGRRVPVTFNDIQAKNIILSASDFLMGEIGPDGKFTYGYYPRFGNEIENYNIVRHASTIWSLICRYRMQGDEELKSLIESTIDYMLTQVVYENEDTAYLLEEKDDEIKLGANGVAVIAMSEYMEVFGSDKYLDVCNKLGNGILAMMDDEDGRFCHVLNPDFTVKENFRTVYYDGEATFALCKLYALTNEAKWLDAAQDSVDRFIREDYTRHKDHWVAYSLNEITKHVTDRADYYVFALQNVQFNLEEIRSRDTTYHTYLELLMSSFEIYDRMMQMGVKIDNFDEKAFIDTIYHRANHMLNGFFYPEYAMYMANPEQILGTFMVRHDGYRVRIDDVQHNIGGYYLYWKNFDKLVSYGMLG